jgi:hypothetical protein
VSQGAASEHSVADTAHALPPWRDPTAIFAAVRHLVASTEPAVVLTSLAAVCASAIADECWATILEVGATEPITIAMPPGADEYPTPATRTVPLAGADQLTLRFSESGWEHYPEFSGTMTWRWHDRDRPTRSDKVIAQLLLDRAIELVRAQRLEAALAAERNMSANLQVALASNREIGQAIGILMSTYKLTSQQGFDLLRLASQHTHRKLRDVALEVCETGMLELPAPKSKA